MMTLSEDTGIFFGASIIQKRIPLQGRAIVAFDCNIHKVAVRIRVEELKREFSNGDIGAGMATIAIDRRDGDDGAWPPGCDDMVIQGKVSSPGHGYCRNSSWIIQPASGPWAVSVFLREPIADGVKFSAFVESIHYDGADDWMGRTPVTYRGEEVGNLSDDGLRNLVAMVRTIIEPTGPLHAMWDTVFDAEIHLMKRTSDRPFQDRPSVEHELVRFVHHTFKNTFADIGKG